MADNITAHMDKSLESLKHNFSKVRTGRANANILSDITVDYYGVPTPVTQVAAVKTPEAHMLLIEPWDKALINAIVKAIGASDLGITPNSDGTVVRLPFPAPTEERRRELVKECAHRLSELPPISSYEADYVKPEPKVDTSGELTIEKFDDMWLVEGPWLQRLVATVNFGDYESRMYFDRVLREAGVFKRMEEMGVRDGDTVSMYDLMFEYQD